MSRNELLRVVQSGSNSELDAYLEAMSCDEIRRDVMAIANESNARREHTEQEYETLSVQTANDEWDTFEYCLALVGKVGELCVFIGSSRHVYNASRWLSVIGTVKRPEPWTSPDRDPPPSARSIEGDGE